MLSNTTTPEVTAQPTTTPATPAPASQPVQPVTTPTTPAPASQPTQPVTTPPASQPMPEVKPSEEQKKIQDLETMWTQKFAALEASTKNLLKEQEARLEEYKKKLKVKRIKYVQWEIKKQEGRHTSELTTLEESMKKLLKEREEKHTQELEKMQKNQEEFFEKAGQFIEEHIKPQSIFNELLYTATTTENLALMKFALKGGANIGVEHEGESLLFYCLKNKKFAAADFLLHQGADLEAKNDNGDTILSRMCKANDEVAVSFILKRSSKSSKEADNFLSILSKKPALENKSVESKLTETEKMIATAALFQGAKQQDGLLLVKQAVEKGANINAQDDESGETPLHIACRFNQTEIVEFLLTKPIKESLLSVDKYDQSPDELTTDDAIKKMLSAYRKKDSAAIVIQSHMRGHFARKEAKVEAEEYRKNLRKECQPYLNEQFMNGNMTAVTELTTLLNSKMLHQSEDAIRKLINKPKEAVADMKNIKK